MKSKIAKNFNKYICFWLRPSCLTGKDGDLFLIHIHKSSGFIFKMIEVCKFIVIFSAFGVAASMQ